MDNSKVCYWCGQRKSLDDFHIKSDAKDGRQKYCKLCRSAISLETNKDPEQKAKRKEQSRRWRINNKEKSREKLQAKRARKKELPTFKVRKKEIIALYAGKCFYCGECKAQELDHVIPTSRGGSHGIGNLVGACQSCNRSKQSKTIMEWRLWKMRLGLHE